MAEDFVTVAKMGDVPSGQMKAFDVAGRKVAVANVAGTFYGFDDTCTHRQCSLAEGELGGTTVTCPCHGSQFDVRTGAVLTPPATIPVKSCQARVQDGALQIAT